MDIISKKHDQLLLKLQKVQISELQDIQLEKALYLPCLYALNKTGKNTLKHVLGTIVVGMKNVAFKISHQDILFLITMYNRKDHDVYYQKIQDIFPEKDKIYLKVGQMRGSVHNLIKVIAFKGLFSRCIKYWKINRMLNSIADKSVRHYLSADILRCILIKSELEAYNLNPKVVFSFFDGNLFENLTIQLFQKKGAICFTNQHGQPVFLGHDVDHLNQSQILNFSSNYFLAKGEFTRQQFINAGISRDRIKVVGSMSYPKFATYFPKNTGKFAVFLDCPSFDFASKTNQKIINVSEKIAEVLGFQYQIKMHPLDLRENYTNLNLKHCNHICEPSETLQDIFSGIEFGIMSASAIYLDLLANGVKPFQLVSDANNYPIVETEADKFRNADEFVESYSKWMALDVSEREQSLKNTLHRYVSNQDCRKELQQLVDDL